MMVELNFFYYYYYYLLLLFFAAPDVSWTHSYGK